MNKTREIPCLYIVVPCYNESPVLPVTKEMFATKLSTLIANKLVTPESRILLVNDGSSDNTWNVICEIAKENKLFVGASLSRNRGHQNALLAGLMEAKDRCDITISIDADGQDDINAMDEMVKAYMDGAEIVYGVRNKRTTDTWFKRFTAESFYKLLNKLGAEVVFNHADYRLLSSRVLNEFANFHEVNLFLRGMIPLVGFKSAKVFYERHERIAGESHYPLSKMLSLACNGITSLSVKPIRLILTCGMLITSFSILVAICLLIKQILGNLSSWTFWLIPFCSFIAGLQFISLGIIGEYIGKIYLETKARPRFVISERVGL